MFIDNARQDLSYAVRGLRTRPGFALAVVLTLGLGIGANAAMFGIVDRLLFRPPALLKDPDTAHRIYLSRTFRGEEFTGGVGQYARFKDLEELTTSFAQTAGYTTRRLAVGRGTESREMQIGVVSASFFSFFDAPTVLGRYFTAAEDQPPSGEPVAVLSHALWQTRYGGSAAVLDSTLQIGPVTYSIVGVAPREFVGLWPDGPPAAWIPITSVGATSGISARNNVAWWQTYSWSWMNMIARRKPGVSEVAANTDVTQAFLQSYRRQLEEQPRSTPIDLARPHGAVGSILESRGPNASEVSKVATWVGGMSLIVLLIACANVANLLLARALRRRREIALRLALGVSRARLAAQLLTESVVLAVAGGAAGLLIAHWGGRVLRAGLLTTSEAPAGLNDLRTVLYAVATAIAVGLLTGLAPIFQSRRADLTSDLKAGTREGTYVRSRTRTALLVLQGALSALLLIGAGLFVRSLNNVHNVRLGYDVDPVLMVDLNMRGVELDSAQKVALRYRLLDAARSMPVVEDASFVVGIPFWSTWQTSLYVAGIDTVFRLGSFSVNAVSPSYFRTFGTRVIRGRGLDESDMNSLGPKVAVVSEGMARTLWPGQDAIGQCMRVGADTVPCTMIVGIAEDIRSQSLKPDSSHYYYLPAMQFNPQTGGLFVRVRGTAARQAEAVRERLQRDMPGAAYVRVTPFSDVVGQQTRSWRLGATMFVAFGALALVIAAVGLYSVIAYTVTQRLHELGVRVALGARSTDLIRLVVGDGIRIAGVGVAAGAIGAVWAGRWVEPLLFNVSPRDPFTFAVVTTALIAVAVTASWLPARRAAAVDPNVVLRSD